MQPTETYNVSRRALDVEDYIDILRRHKGWIFGPFLFTVVASVVGVYLWPDVYNSSGEIKVEPQRLPTSLVPQVMTQDMSDHINSMLTNIESRDSLAEIINNLNLYPKERPRLPLDDIIDEMKQQIHIEMIGVQAGSHQVPAFKVSFSYPDRHLVQKVTQALITKFVDASSSSSSDLTFNSMKFMQDQADGAKKELDAVEDRLAQYKTENNGRLPEQENSNFQKLNSLESSAAAIDSQITRTNADKLMYTSQLNLFHHTADELAQIKPDPVTVAQQQQQQKSPQRQRAEAEVESWTNQLRNLKQHYTDTYPEVVTANREMSEAQKRLDAIVKDEAAEKEKQAKEAKKEASPGKPAVSEASVKEALARETTEAHYTMQISADDNQIEDLNRQLALVNKQEAALQTRLNSVPQNEKDYVDLRRDQELKNIRYQEAIKNLEKAKLQRDMENQQEGERLEMLDGATLPDSAASPNRVEDIGVGAAVGLILGIVIAGFREMKDTSLKNLKDVRAYTQMTILGSIPLLENDFVVRRRRRLAWLGWTAACLTAVVLMSGSVMYWFYATKQ